MTRGFYAPFGPTTAERRHPRFMFHNPHDCLWNGPSWPYATSQTLTAMANLLNDEEQNVVGNKDYLQILTNYAARNTRTASHGSRKTSTRPRGNGSSISRGAFTTTTRRIAI